MNVKNYFICETLHMFQLINIFRDLNWIIIKKTDNTKKIYNSIYTYKKNFTNTPEKNKSQLMAVL